MQKLRLIVTLNRATPTIATLEKKLARFRYRAETAYRGRGANPKNVPRIFAVPENVSLLGLRRELAEFLAGGDGALIDSPSND